MTDPAPTEESGSLPVERSPMAPATAAASGMPAAGPGTPAAAPGTSVAASATALGAPAITPAAAVDPAFERRAFVRRMGSDAVRTAGSIFSVSRILTRSAAAAGQAVMTELESLQVGNAAEEPVGRPTADPFAIPAAGAEPAAPEEAAAAAEEPAVTGTGAGPAAPAVPAATDTAPGAASPAATTTAAHATFAKPPAPAPPPLTIDPDQRALLEGATTAVVAVNREGHPPQLTTATVLWDGGTIRFATLGWARRTTMLRADPRIGLLVDGPGDGRFVTVTGRARITDGRDAHDAAWPLLLREVGGVGEAAAEARWQELVAEDLDRAVIVVEPEQVLSGRR